MRGENSAIYKLNLIIILFSWVLGFILDFKTGFAHLLSTCIVFCFIVFMIVKLHKAKKSGKVLNPEMYVFGTLLVGILCLGIGIFEVLYLPFLIVVTFSIIVIALFPTMSGMLFLYHAILFRRLTKPENPLKKIVAREKVLISSKGLNREWLGVPYYDAYFFVVLGVFIIIGLSLFYVVGDFVLIIICLLSPLFFLLNRFAEVYCLTETRIIFLPNSEEFTYVHYKDIAHIRVIWKYGYLKYIYIFRCTPSRRYYTGEEADYLYEDYEGDWGFVLNFARSSVNILGQRFLNHILEKSSLKPHEHLKDIYFQTL